MCMNGLPYSRQTSSLDSSELGTTHLVLSKVTPYAQLVRFNPPHGASPPNASTAVQQTRIFGFHAVDCNDNICIITLHRNGFMIGS